MELKISSGTLEALKWFALLLMLGDHVNLALFDRQLPLLSEVARIVFPIFAILLGYNMARPGVDQAKTLGKLVVFAMIAQPFHMLAFDMAAVPLNVLWTFVVAVGAMVAWGRGWQALAVVLVAVGGLLVDYAWPGVAMVLTAWLFFRDPQPHRIVAAFLAAASLYLVNGNFYALWAFPVVLLASTVDFSVPRSPWAFYVLYPAHLAVLAVFVLGRPASALL